MEDYTKEDVLTALQPLVYKTRKRALVDQRSYLIGILAYRFMIPEHTIAKTIGIKRDVVNHNKRLVIQMYSDKSYQANTYVYAQRFPFDFSVIDAHLRLPRSVRVELSFDAKFYKKLKAVGGILGHRDIRTTIKLFLEKSLVLWEK
jgi:hypothetical protein